MDPNDQPASAPSSPPSAVDRFRSSMIIDHEKWHDGIGYDLEALAAASDGEREAIERLLLQRGAADWRDVEALAALDTPATREALAAVLADGTDALRLAVLRHAPQIAGVVEQIAALVRALEHAPFYDGLTQALDQVEQVHPPSVVDALFRGVLAREGEVAVHFAAMLMFLFGKAEEPFDFGQRPYFLRFHTDDPTEREVMLRDLCGRVGVSAERYLQGSED